MDTANGRFTTRDTFLGIPIDPTTLTPYVYGSNNPIDLTDVSGHYATLGDEVAAGAVLGTLVGLGLDALVGLYNQFAHPDWLNKPRKSHNGEVLVDTGAIYQWYPPQNNARQLAGAKSLLKSGETPVISFVVAGELWLNELKVSSGEFRGLSVPSWISEFTPVGDEGSEAERTGVKFWLMRHNFKQDTTGLEGDSTLLTTAMVTGRPLITTDRRLASGAMSLSVEARLFQQSTSNWNP